MYTLKSEREISKIKDSCKIVAEVLHIISKEVVPGMTTEDVDKRAYDLTIKLGAKPAFKGYHGFPKTICASVNDEVVHGIPDSRVLKEGDIIGIDFGVVYDGWYGDSAITVPVGNVTAECKKLMKITEESLYKAIDVCIPGNRIGDIGNAVQCHVEPHGYGVVREFVGHGIGRALHEDPQIPNYGKTGTGVKLQAGMVIAIEPMVTAGDFRVKVLKNNWTAVTVDGSLAAHFEHTVAITSNGPVILTDRTHLI
ncbi:MAG: type I methionyl aminopeptidase [Oligoflexia bacterium]|nr:type I methionyl aminopeptidase [Oligoflexia bacterium]